ncbi:MAG: peptide deformylase [Negativicutes bacterium]
MVLDVVVAGAPILKQIADEVKFVGRNERCLLNDMADTMYAHDGVGLAAPQIGFAVRIIVVDDGNGLIEMVNPVITEASGSVVDEEGCLSCPGFTGPVSRYEQITVEGLDRSMRKVSLICSGLLARIFQHEIDHLDGVLFTEKAISLAMPNAEA